MRRYLPGLASVASAIAFFHIFTAASLAATPTTAAVIDKMIAAYGGRTVLDSIKTKVEVVSISIRGQAGTITSTEKKPNKFLEVISIPGLGFTSTTGFDGKSAWTSDAYGNVKALSGDQLNTVRCQAVDETSEMLHPDGSTAVAVRPNKTIDGKSYVTLLFSKSGCPSETLYVDPKTDLVVRTSSSDSTIVLSNYTSGPAGEKYPKTVTVTNAMATYVGTVTSLKDNPQVDDSAFAMPPMPSPSPAATGSPTAAPAMPAASPTSSP